MDKKKIELMATGLLILVFLITLGNSIMKIRSKSVPRPAAVAPVSAAEAAAKRNPMKPEKEFISKEAFKKDIRERSKPVWGRDPFMREDTTISADTGISSLKLMGITTGKKSMAIVNNEIVNVGSKIGKFTVLKIVKDRVVLTDGSENFDLILNK